MCQDICNVQGSHLAHGDSPVTAQRLAWGAAAHAIPRMSETSGIWPRPGKVGPKSVPGVGILSAP